MPKQTIEYTADDFSFLMCTNLESAYHMCQLAYPLLKASGAGSIVFVSSVAGVVGLTLGVSIYAAAKGGLNQLAKNLACEWAKDNIRSNSVAPWVIKTPLAEPFLSNEKFLEAVNCQTPLGRIGEPKEVASGEKVNTEKTTAFFSRNTSEEVKESLRVLLNVPIIQDYEKYLGLPSFVGRQKKACFTKIKECIWAKMQGWKEKLLSQAGKEVMIKAVVQSIPTYSMSVFRLPVGFLKDIEAMIQKFWWGCTENSRKIHWVRWETLCSSKSVGGMGFRDLRLFNDALLGKQVEDWGWEGYSDLAASLDFIFSGKVLSPRLDQSLDVVQDLFIPGTKTWDSEIIDRLFLPWEAECIKSIPLSDHQHSDLLIWHYTPDGCYSVRSAYRFLAVAQSQDQPSSSNIEASKRLWKGVWKIEVPNKVRHFIWRAVGESLPTKKNLMKRCIVSDALCGLCESEVEDSIHALWLCDGVKPIWMSNQSFSFLRAQKLSTFEDLVFYMLQNASSSQVALFSMIAWVIWERRNRLRVHQPVWDVGNVVDRASALLREFRDVQKLPLRRSVPREAVKWSPPAEGLYKVNFDGAVFEDQACAGLGVVIRDSAGLVIGVLSQKIRLPSSMVTVEALAARRAVMFAKEISVFRVVVEGDSLQVIKAVNNSKLSMSSYGHIIDEIRLLSTSFSCCNFVHVQREGNKLAHALAHRVVLSVDFDVWMEDLPRDLDDVFLFDLA
ncbi:hypothetical protein SO802_018321 [Lithocarpus litseifolius]|uniref:RNase H type-1 domain-containing protein n=1 Tax=Lithocarpus litseifolius TaxID=425828 RepID=A0AAW2CMJ5_9ROSI